MNKITYLVIQDRLTQNFVAMIAENDVADALLNIAKNRVIGQHMVDTFLTEKPLNNVIIYPKMKVENLAELAGC